MRSPLRQWRFRDFRQTGCHAHSLHLSSGISNYDAPLITLMERAFATRYVRMSSIRIWGSSPSSGTPLQHTSSLYAPYSSRHRNCCLSSANFSDMSLVSSRTRNASRWLGQIGTARSTLDCLTISSLPSLRAGAVSGIPRSHHAGNRPRSRDRPVETQRHAIAYQCPRLTRSHAEYYQTVIEPFAGPSAGRIGRRTHRLGNAMCSAMPLPCSLHINRRNHSVPNWSNHWLAGLPVIAHAAGCVTEILEQGVSGVICQTFEELFAAPACIPLLSRHECRQAFESRFTVERMARDYVEVYHQMLGQPFWLTRSTQQKQADSPAQNSVSHAKASSRRRADSRLRARPSSPSSSVNLLIVDYSDRHPRRPTLALRAIRWCRSCPAT